MRTGTLRADENPRQILAYRISHKVFHALTVQCDRMMYLLDDTPETRTSVQGGSGTATQELDVDAGCEFDHP